MVLRQKREREIVERTVTERDGVHTQSMGYLQSQITGRVP